MLLAKGANKLARNKKGRKPGDVFSPSVEDADRKRIKLMLGMGEVQDPPIVAAPAPSLAPTSETSTSESTAAPGGREDAANGVSRRGVGGGGGGGAPVGRNGTLAGPQYGDIATAPSNSSTALPPPAYKVRGVFFGEGGVTIIMPMITVSFAYVWYLFGWWWWWWWWW